MVGFRLEIARRSDERGSGAGTGPQHKNQNVPVDDVSVLMSVKQLIKVRNDPSNHRDPTHPLWRMDGPPVQNVPRSYEK